MKRIIYIGADSAGFNLKEDVKTHLAELGYEVVDCGCDSTASCHYPEFASKVSKAVQANLDGAFGILVCGTGIGMSMCANKYKGIRAAVCGDTFSARMTRCHNDANVLCIEMMIFSIAKTLKCFKAPLPESTITLTAENSPKTQNFAA